VLELVRRREVTAVASWRLAEEIVEVLRRPRLKRYRITERDIEDTLIVLAPLLPDVEVDVEVRDPDDTPVISAALAGAADVIITGDRGLLGDAVLRSWLSERGIEMMPPVDFLDRSASR
jgi:putative PIN family toxin of toxin-antitoxin system